MSLHRRTVLTVTLSVAVLVIASFVASQVIILGGFERLEQDAVASDLERAKRALSGEVAQLDSTAKDWAAWDDTYDFVAGANASYVDENLGEDVFLNLRFSFLYYLNEEGNTVYAKAVDLESGVQAELPGGLEPWIAPGSPLTVYADVNSHIQGLLLLPEGPALISSRPILRNYGEGPIGGSLIAGRWLDDAQTAHLADQAQLSLAFVPVQNAAPPADIAAAKPIVERDGTATSVLDGQRIAGYTLLKDVFDSPALIMRIDIPRSVYAQGQTVLNYMVLALLLGGGAFGAQTIYQLQHQVLSRVSHLGREVSAIGQSRNLEARVSVDQGDELGKLATDINGMLQSFDQTQDMLHEMEARLHLVLSSMPVILFVLDCTGRLSLVTGAGLDLLSLTPDAALGKPLAVLFGNSEGAFESLNRVLDGNAVRDTVQAGQIAFDIWLLPQYDAEHTMTGAIGMAVDVTARQRSEHTLEQMETDLRAQNTRLEQAYTYFSGVLTVLQGAVRQGGKSGDVLALLGEAEVAVLAHKSGTGGPHNGNNHRTCPNLNRCPAFRLLQLQAREVFMELYCEAEYERCARHVSASRGERVPDNLMPHGVML